MSSAREIVKRRLKAFPPSVSDYSIEQCVELTRLALLLDARNPELNYYLAYFYAVAGKPSQSLIYVRRALKFGFTPVRKITHSAVFRQVRALNGFSDVMDKHFK